MPSLDQQPTFRYCRATAVIRQHNATPIRPKPRLRARASLLLASGGCFPS